MRRIFFRFQDIKGLLVKETPEMLLQDNQDITLTDEEKQRLVQSDLQPGQVIENQIHRFHFLNKIRLLPAPFLFHF